MTMREILLDSGNLLPRPEPPSPVAVDEMTQRIPDVSRARRHIIKRPRLTRLLDETSARVILLVAPAGYGKTTLAREWLEGVGKPYAWYSATPASADVAVLASGISRSLEEFAAGAPDRLSHLLRAPRESHFVAALADMLTEELRRSPETTLAIDDCHLASSVASEQLLQALAYGSTNRLLLTSRVRPAWVSARSILYGEAAEFGPQALSFSPHEAAEVLSHRGNEPGVGLLALADGWPAVIGLAALGDRIALPEGELAHPLYEYIARELFDNVSQVTRLWMQRLSIVREPSLDLLEHLADAEAQVVVDEGVRRGLLSVVTGGRIEMHPLLQKFLQGQAAQDPQLSQIAASAARYFQGRSSWDEAYQIALEYQLHESIVEVVTKGFSSLLVDGRTSTLHDWLTTARAFGDDPELDLIEAELAFLEADPSRSRTLAARAESRLPEGSRLRSRAHLRVAYASFILEHLDEAAERFQAAERFAKSASERRGALWGRFLSSVHSDLDAARLLLADLEEIACLDEPDDLVLISQARLELALQGGGLDAALEAAEPARHLVERVDDPQRRTAFYLALSWAAHLTARYQQSLETANRLLDESQQYRLAFALPHALVARAAALSGLRRFGPARRDLREAARMALGEAHTQANAACCEARIDLVTGRRSAALDRLARGPAKNLAAPMRAEYLATRALVLACLGNADALVEADAATQISPAIEAEVLTAAARAVLEARNGGDRSVVARLVSAVQRTGDIDGAILAWRASPPLLPILEELGGDELAVRLTPTLADQKIARRQGMSVARSGVEPLSPREEEVLQLVARGMRNKEIARELFISEVTVKAHVRSILRKLGARTRVEAALHARGEK